MSTPSDPAILEFYAGLPQQGPGSDADAEAVLRAIQHGLPENPLAADLGCGTGRSALFLAEQLRTKVLALDLAACFLKRLADEAARRGLSSLIGIREGDMAAPPIPSGALDLLWSEGAAYILGFAEALRLWRPLLKRDAICVVSECTWLSEPPEAAARFFADGYPEMTTVPGNTARAQAAGYRVLGTHVVSLMGWERYYGPIKKAVRDGVTDRVSPAFTRELTEEIAVFEQAGGSYGYVFYMLKREDA
jgi:SAM-dependent methyltransferase